MTSIPSPLRTVILFALLLAPCALTAQDAQPAPSDDLRLKNLLFRDNEQTIRERFRYFYEQRAYPFASIPDGARESAWQDAQRMPVIRPAAGLAKGAGSATASWTVTGPVNAGGRITGVAVHPTNPAILYFTAADGGVWKSIDTGHSFTPISENLPTMSMGAIEIDPVNPNIIYAGTGEANGSGDCYPGVGVAKSTDAGATWTITGGAFAANIAKIRVNPFDPHIVIAATRQGLYRSSNAGANWTQVKAGTAFDIVFHPTKPATAFAAIQGIGVLRSIDTGRTWDTLAIGVRADSVGRIGIDLCRAQPDIIYGVIVAAKGTSNLKAIIKSTNGGNSWVKTNSTSTPNFFSTYGWYLVDIAVHPTDPNRIMAGGVSIYMSTNGGYNWSSRSGPHVDHHAMEYSPSHPNMFFLGSDGGFYRSKDSGRTYIDCNANIPITQFYELGIALSNPAMMGGGTQDNGSKLQKTGTPVWTNATGGDGGYFVIDPLDTKYMYAEYQNGSHMRTQDSGRTWSSNNSGLVGSSLWVTPVAIHPVSTNILFTATTKKLYKSTNHGASWFQFHAGLDSSSSINVISVSSIRPNIMLVGYSSGKVWRTIDAGASWTNISTGLPTRTCKDLIFDPVRPGTFYTCFSGYSAASVYKTVDSGATWMNISGNLPAIPKNALEINPSDTSNIFVGTDFGVYASTNAGATWAILGDGMPKVVIADLELHPGTGMLFAATHGRSVYQLAVTTPVELMQFSATLDGDAVRLSWKTSNEYNSRGFSIERRTLPGGSWEDIGFVDGGGTSSSVRTYSFRDAALPAAALSLSYRLKQVDFDGSFEYSPEAQVQLSSTAPGDFALEQNYPNPFNPVTTIRYHLPVRAEVRLSITDALGAEVAELVRSTQQAGTYLVPFDASALPGGAYFYHLVADGRVLTRRMLLLK